MKCIYSARLGPGPAHHREEWETCSLVCSAPRRSPGLPLPRGAGPGWSGRSSWGLQAEAPLLPGARAGWVPPSTASPSPTARSSLQGAQLPGPARPPHPIVPAPPREVSGGMSRLCLPFLPFGFVGEGMCGVGATGKRWIMCLFFNSKKKPTSRIPVCSPWTWAFRLLPLTEEEAASGHGQPRSAPSLHARSQLLRPHPRFLSSPLSGTDVKQWGGLAWPSLWPRPRPDSLSLWS